MRIFSEDPLVDKYGLMGHPVAHSISPQIHQAFALQTKQKILYEKFDVEPENFASTLKEFQEQGKKGLNITLPYKTEAFKLAKKLSDSATECGAVNTILFTENNEIFGDNTDGPGLIQDLVQNHQYTLRGKKILVIGAGGAAREIVPALLKQAPASIVISNRTLEKAVELSAKFAMKGDVSAKAFSQLGQESFDLIINASSAGITGPFPEFSGQLIHSHTWCYDLVYNPKFDSFLKWAEAFHPEKCIDGVGMLVEQAALAFYLWRGVAPETKPIIEQLRGDRELTAFLNY